ncbi:hypothetical protein TSUD_320470 [Trifolium subterraneum]|uniref:Zinc knuckle CX2CX4HX4C domain-containing protein n=1 Tax=Trifolium subterraneum TaxID=3900 RepID=A0A2Z6MXC6_TRISU|nr:hypothetical protein TSUD_320470 [Trifolium subterraneum]
MIQTNFPKNQVLTIVTQIQEANKQDNQHPQPKDIPESSITRTQAPTQQNIPRSFLYAESIIHEGINTCKRSIIGKIITDKPIHISSIQNGLESIWGSPVGLKIQELEGKIIQFYINNEDDHNRILLGNPWDREGESIGELMGKVEASEFYEYPEKKVIIKIKVAINIHNPILTGIHIGNPIDGTCWIDYRYEKLPQVCFKCALIGHSDKLCRNQPFNWDTLAPLGPWIRSIQYGRRKMEEKDKKFYSNPSHSKEFGHYSPPIPTDLLEKLAAMKVQSEPAVNPTNNQQDQPTNHPTKPGPSPMEEMQLTHEDRTKKIHRISHNLEPVMQDKSLETGMVDHVNQVKRQKMENSSRVGLARQASPQP